jgi:hypothetical protein
MTKLRLIIRSREEVEHLLGLILPREGYRAGATVWKPRDSDSTILYNRLFETDADLAQWAAARGAHENVWHSTATFKEVEEKAEREFLPCFKGRRDESNIHSRQCFHGDIDVGEDKPYVRFEHARAALEWACAKLGLPPPIVIRSGHGLHFYWPLTEPIADMRLWRAYAEGILATLVGQGLKLDAQCSVDPVRILRPPGTFNFKNGRVPVLVEDWGAGPTPLSAFNQFKGKMRRKPRSERKLDSPVDPLPLAEFPAVVRRCRQMNNFARLVGAVSEPEWMACIGILAFVENGREIAHAYSKGDPRYDPDETDKKFDERREHLIGPITCRHFQTLNNLCDACTWRSPWLRSPLRIGDGR